MNNFLNSISQSVKQKIYECISQALGEDRQEADMQLDLKTHVSGPFLNWDLIYRNLICSFGDENVKYSTSVRGMWTVLLLYDIESKLLISFMRDTRLKDIKRVQVENRPQYIQALISLNNELQSSVKQLSFDNLENENYGDETELMQTLDDLCYNLGCDLNYGDMHHALVCFSGKFGEINSLNAYILDRDLDIVCEEDWLSAVKPIISNITEMNDSNDAPLISLTPKATKHLEEKELVTLKENEKSNQA